MSDGSAGTARLAGGAGSRRFGTMTSQTLSKRISRELVGSILRGESEPDHALPSEDELASQFDVSRPVIREAIKELAVLGLVQSRQGRSTRVTPRSAWNNFSPELLAVRGELGAVDDILLELLELRRLIEVGAAGLAATRAAPDDIERMTATFELMEASKDDTERFTDADMAFHGALLAATGNDLLTRLIDLLGPLLRFGRAKSLELRPDGPTDSQRGHRAVLDAIRAGDAEGARDAMREHLSWTANLRLPDDDVAPGAGLGRGA